MLIRISLLIVLASSLGGCAFLAGAVIGGAIEHEYNRNQQWNGLYGWNGPPYPYRYRYREQFRETRGHRR